MRIGFLFNHVATHQVPHAAPYAFELSRRHPEHEVTIGFSSEPEHRVALEIATLYPGHRCTYRSLAPPLYLRALEPLISRQKFRRKKWVLGSHLDFFRSLDVLVAPERNCVRLRTKFELNDLIMIHTRHGAGDRDGSFDDRLKSFDFFVLPGQKTADRLRDLGYLSDDNFAVSGCTKFEVVRRLAPDPPRIFDDDKPVVVYNPHFENGVSSWQKIGHDVLNFFADHPEYNLIFAPHVLLFRRRGRHEVELPGDFSGSPNIFIDKGSRASNDMTYLRAADIYLGDASSQVYEFLQTPRPCIFLNAYGVDWQEDPAYAHWHLGDVVDDVDDDLGPALESAGRHHASYLPAQTRAFAHTYHVEAENTPAARGADAIAAFLSRRPQPGA